MKTQTMVDLEDISRHLLAAPHYYCMELHGLFALCWCVLSGSGKLAVGDGWNRVSRFWRSFRRKPREFWWHEE